MPRREEEKDDVKGKEGKCLFFFFAASSAAVLDHSGSHSFRQSHGCHCFLCLGITTPSATRVTGGCEK
jgi:hypothetical protein